MDEVDLSTMDPALRKHFLRVFSAGDLVEPGEEIVPRGTISEIPRHPFLTNSEE